MTSSCTLWPAGIEGLGLNSECSLTKMDQYIHVVSTMIHNLLCNKEYTTLDSIN